MRLFLLAVVALAAAHAVAANTYDCESDPINAPLPEDESCGMLDLSCFWKDDIDLDDFPSACHAQKLDLLDWNTCGDECNLNMERVRRQMSDIGLSREFDDCANELKLDGWKFFFSDLSYVEDEIHSLMACMKDAVYDICHAPSEYDCAADPFHHLDLQSDCSSQKEHFFDVCYRPDLEDYPDLCMADELHIVDWDNCYRDVVLNIKKTKDKLTDIGLRVEVARCAQELEEKKSDGFFDGLFGVFSNSDRDRCESELEMMHQCIDREIHDVCDTVHGDHLLHGHDHGPEEEEDDHDHDDHDEDDLDEDDHDEDDHGDEEEDDVPPASNSEVEPQDEEEEADHDHDEEEEANEDKSAQEQGGDDGEEEEDEVVENDNGDGEEEEKKKKLVCPKFSQEPCDGRPTDDIYGVGDVTVGKLKDNAGITLAIDMAHMYYDFQQEAEKPEDAEDAFLNWLKSIDAYTSWSKRVYKCLAEYCRGFDCSHHEHQHGNIGGDEEGAEEAGDEDDKDCPPNEEDADADADADAEPAEDEAQQGEEDQDLDGEGCFEPTIIQIYRKTENGQDLFIVGGNTVDGSEIPLHPYPVGDDTLWTKYQGWIQGKEALSPNWPDDDLPLRWTSSDPQEELYSYYNDHSDHVWELESDMNCCRAKEFKFRAHVVDHNKQNGDWNYDDWEDPNGFYHVGECGKINYFVWQEDTVETTEMMAVGHSSRR